MILTKYSQELVSVRLLITCTRHGAGWSSIPRFGRLSQTIRFLMAGLFSSGSTRRRRLRASRPFDDDVGGFALEPVAEIRGLRLTVLAGVRPRESHTVQR